MPHRSPKGLRHCLGRKGFPFSDPLKFGQELFMVQSEIFRDPFVADQSGDVAACKNEVEMIDPIAILSQSHLPFEVRRLVFHKLKLFARNPFDFLWLGTSGKLAFGCRCQQRPGIVYGIFVHGDHQLRSLDLAYRFHFLENPKAC